MGVILDAMCRRVGHRCFDPRTATLFERNRLEGRWRVRTREANGVRERVVSPAYELVEVGPAPDWMLMPNRAVDEVLDADWLAEKREENQRRAAKRAKQACKWTIISEGFNELLTLTNREGTHDVGLFKRRFKEWVRRMKKAIPGFRYCAGFEPHKSGAWHAHVATHKLPVHAEYKGVKIPAWRVGTEIWRSICGADNGLCYVGGKPAKWGHKRRKNMGLYKLANYVSKYITKGYELLPDEKNRYSRSDGVVRVKVHDAHFAADCIGELIGLCFEVDAGDDVVAHRLDRVGDFYMFATDRGGGLACQRKY